MDRLQRLKLLVRLTKNKSNVASKHFSEGMAFLNKHKAKLKDLHTYESEYHDQMNSRADEGAISSTEVLQYHQFIKQLEHIIERQEHTIHRAKAEVEKRRVLWVQAHQQHDALDRYIEKLEQEHKDAQEKAEQKALDTLVTDTYRPDKPYD